VRAVPGKDARSARMCQRGRRCRVPDCRDFALPDVASTAGPRSPSRIGVGAGAACGGSAPHAHTGKRGRRRRVPDRRITGHNCYSRKLAPWCAIQTLDHRRDAGALWASAFALAAAPPGFAPAPALAFAPAAPPPGAAFPCVVKASSNPTSRSTLRGCCRLGSAANLA
jgi:hypothetical protein